MFLLALLVVQASYVLFNWVLIPFFYLKSTSLLEEPQIPVYERPSVQDLRALLELESVYEVELQKLKLNDELEMLPLRQQELKANFETIVNELLGDENFKRFEKSQYNFLN